MNREVKAAGQGIVALVAFPFIWVWNKIKPKKKDKPNAKNDTGV